MHTKAITILQKTHDGNDLAPPHLSLVEAAVNGWLTENGVQAFNQLYTSIINGSYTKPWMCGIQHLTQDNEGYVYWKGIQIEHYSHADYDEKHKAAKELGKRCQKIETLGLNVSGNLAIWRWHWVNSIDADSPWVPYLSEIPPLYHDPVTDAIVLLFEHPTKGTAIKINPQGKESIESFSKDVDACGYHIMKALGYDLFPAGQPPHQGSSSAPWSGILEAFAKYNVRPSQLRGYLRKLAA